MLASARHLLRLPRASLLLSRARSSSISTFVSSTSLSVSDIRLRIRQSPSVYHFNVKYYYKQKRELTTINIDNDIDNDIDIDYDHDLQPALFISNKRYNTLPHTSSDIRSFIRLYNSGLIEDYQMSAWLMAVCCKGCTPQETAALTQAMVDSGDVADLSDVPGTR